MEWDTDGLPKTKNSQKHKKKNQKDTKQAGVVPSQGDVLFGSPDIEEFVEKEAKPSWDSAAVLTVTLPPIPPRPRRDSRRDPSRTVGIFF